MNPFRLFIRLTHQIKIVRSRWLLINLLGTKRMIGSPWRSKGTLCRIFLSFWRKVVRSKGFSNALTDRQHSIRTTDLKTMASKLDCEIQCQIWTFIQIPLMRSKARVRVTCPSKRPTWLLLSLLRICENPIYLRLKLLLMFVNPITTFKSSHLK